MAFPPPFEGQLLIQDHGVPRVTVAAATGRLYQWSPTGKFHSGSRCPHIKNKWGSNGAVVVSADRLVMSRCCTCLGSWLPKAFQPILTPLRELADLDRAARVLLAQHAEHHPLDLTQVAALRQNLQRLPQTRRTLAEALAGSPATLRPTALWLREVTRRARSAAAVVDTQLDADPTRTLRAAAAMIMPNLVGTGVELQAATTRHGACHWVTIDAQDELGTSLAEGADLDVVRSRVLAVLEDESPSELSQIPTDAVMPAGMSLGEAMTAAWRQAARAELEQMLEAALADYTDLVRQSDPVLLVTTPVPDVPPELGALLGAAPSTVVTDAEGTAVQVWLVPRVVGRAAASTRFLRAFHPGAPVPGDADLTGPAGIAALFASDYTITLARLARQLDPEAAVTAATAVAAPAGHAA